MIEDSSRRIGWGVLSTGHIASVFASDLTLLPEEARLVAVGSRSLDKAEAFAAQYGFERSYGSYAELVADPDIDVVYVASVHNDHLASARLCLAAGKSVLVEKPLTTSAEDSAELVDLARQMGLFLMEAVWMRTNPLIRQAAAIVASGELGPVRHIAASFGFAFDGPASHRLLDPVQAGGTILDSGLYPVHAVNLFLGEPSRLLGFGTHAATGVDAHAAALLVYDATAERPAATANVVSTLELNLPNRLEVDCARGRIMIDGFLIKPEELVVIRSDGTEPEVMITQLPGGGYTFQAGEVMRCLRAGETESAMVPWADTLAVARTLDRWLESVGPPAAEGAP